MAERDMERAEVAKATSHVGEVEQELNLLRDDQDQVTLRQCMACPPGVVSLLQTRDMGGQTAAPTALRCLTLTWLFFLGYKYGVQNGPAASPGGGSGQGEGGAAEPPGGGEEVGVLSL